MGRTAPPRNADPRGPAPISGAPAAEAEGRAAGLGQGRAGGENSVPRPKWRADMGGSAGHFAHGNPLGNIKIAGIMMINGYGSIPIDTLL